MGDACTQAMGGTPAGLLVRWLQGDLIAALEISMWLLGFPDGLILYHCWGWFQKSVEHPEDALSAGQGLFSPGPSPSIHVRDGGTV